MALKARSQRVRSHGQEAKKKMPLRTSPKVANGSSAGHFFVAEMSPLGEQSRRKSPNGRQIVAGRQTVAEKSPIGRYAFAPDRPQTSRSSLTRSGSARRAGPIAVRLAMSFDVFRAIKEHAQNDSTTAAGNLHEEIWADLLRRSDARFHNARVTRGDGGIDGIQFIDPATGEARVYQAKFFQDLKEVPAKKAKTKKKPAPATSGHRAEVVDAFVRAHSHQFACTSWVLLLPCALSHTDLNWLMGTMKTEAMQAAARRTGLPPDIDKRVAACAVEFMDGDNLNALLMQYLDVAAKHLPRSSLSLMKALKDERAARDRDRDDLADVLRRLRDESIRSHQAETRRARAALAILAQGWANLTAMLQSAMVDEKIAGKALHEVARQVEEHAEDRAVHAYSCEGLAPGASALVSEILFQSRLLQQVAIVKSVGMAEPESDTVIAKRILEKTRELQELVGRTSKLLSQ